MRIMITGAGGFVGRRLVRHLKLTRPGDDIVGLTREGAGGVDLTDSEACARAVSHFRPETVLHLAAKSSVGQGGHDPAGSWRANFDGTRNLVEAARRTGDALHFIFASSAEVYGDSFNLGPRSETSPLAPLSTYGRTKAASEYFLKDLSDDTFRTTVLRLFSHVGPGQDYRFVVPSFAQQIALAEQGSQPAIVRVGNLSAERDFTDVGDILRAYELVLAAGAEGGVFSVYNVGSGRLWSVGSILDFLLGMSDKAIEVVTDPTRMRPSDVPSAAGVFDRFESRFGWRSDIAFEETLKVILDHERAALATT